MGQSSSFFSGRFSGDLDVDAFAALCADPAGGVATPHAATTTAGIPAYDGDTFRAATDEDAAESLRAELANVFGHGAGVIVIRNGWSDRGALDAMTDALLAVIERERANGDGFDHFASSGANSRAWDVLGKVAKLDPAAHVNYYGNRVLDLVSEAWLGPWYQVTAQVNIVHPGGAAQSPHRDYHLGFLSNADAARFPSHVHHLSQALTLQGAVAHSPMPIDAGPTMLLPGSQRYGAGYLAWRDERFKAHFEKHAVQVELEPGDAVFFNPALHHAAGENRTDDHNRIGNLLQVSSAFGVPMEAIDWDGVASSTYPVLLGLAEAGELHEAHIATCASGYAFPSNLDTDASDSGLAPASMQDLLRTALNERMTVERFNELLRAKRSARQAFT
jgi:ectoine hydroxylase-related dioxygenase (phytanoyl-CoA dioxygenase family)